MVFKAQLYRSDERHTTFTFPGKRGLFLRVYTLNTIYSIQCVVIKTVSLSFQSIKLALTAYINGCLQMKVKFYTGNK